MMQVTPVTLCGRYVRLEPLSIEHVPDLAKVGLSADIWRFMLYGKVETEAQMRLWVEDMLERQASGNDLPFAVIHLLSGQAIGASRYLEIRRAHYGLEIGGTWYAQEFQRTAVNTESKYLLLKHAFECLGCIRVQFKTDLRNVRSQKALERLGVVKEGVFRNHLITPDGTQRSSVFYSIIDSEWPAIKKRLEEFLSRK
jgi:RimJ/RimL family protein N-acetyltransferase